MTPDFERRVADLLIGESAVMRRLRETILRFAPSRIPILLFGPTGSGKELVAQSLHLASGRRGDLAAFNVCAVSETMLEDALFGHVRGAFTGATSDSAGYLREANGGTLFLDEVTGMPLSAQVKLLRAIETGVYRPVGATRDQRSDFRVVAATNVDPAAHVAAGRFRADLLHRLGGLVLHVPSLAERRGDVPLLVRHFTSRSEFGRPVVFTDAALDRLAAQEWSGNVRELRHAVDRIALFSADGVVSGGLVDDLIAPSEHRAPSEADVFTPRRLKALLEEVDWNVDLVAERLGVHRTTLYRRLRRLGIERGRETQRL